MASPGSSALPSLARASVRRIAEAVILVSSRGMAAWPPASVPVSIGPVTIGSVSVLLTSPSLQLPRDALILALYAARAPAPSLGRRKAMLLEGAVVADGHPGAAARGGAAAEL